MDEGDVGEVPLQRGHGVAIPREEGVDIRVAEDVTPAEVHHSDVDLPAHPTAHGAVEVPECRLPGVYNVFIDGFVGDEPAVGAGLGTPLLYRGGRDTVIRIDAGTASSTFIPTDW